METLICSQKINIYIFLFLGICISFLFFVPSHFKGTCSSCRGDVQDLGVRVQDFELLAASVCGSPPFSGVNKEKAKFCFLGPPKFGVNFDSPP